MKYIRFETNVWRVVHLHDGYAVGEIKWYGPWRQYMFFPHAETVYSAWCLDDITAFIREQMKMRKEKKGGR